MARLLTAAVRAALVARWSAVPALSTPYATGAEPPQITRHATDRWVGRERIVIDQTDGEMSIPTMRAGAKTTEHTFTVTVLVVAAIPGWSADENEARAVELAEAIIGDLTDTQTGPVLSGAVPGLVWCKPGQVRTRPDLVSIDGADVQAHVVELDLECLVRG